MPEAKFIKVIVYKWPESQVCMECRHSGLVESSLFGGSAFICERNCTKNTGSNCPKFVPKDPED